MFSQAGGTIRTVMVLIIGLAALGLILRNPAGVRATFNSASNAFTGALRVAVRGK